MDALLKERYAYVTKVMKEHKRELLRLATSLLKYETLSGENAKRVMEGKEPVPEKKRDLEKERHLSQIYHTLSLVNMFMIRDGELVNRVKMEEENQFYASVVNNSINSNGESLGINMISKEFLEKVNDLKFQDLVKKKYWELLEERSLKDSDPVKLAEKYK